MPSICFCIKLLYTTSSFSRLHQISTTTEIISPDSCTYVVTTVVSRSQPDSYFCIARSWKFRFAMITWVRAKLFTDSTGKTSPGLSKCFSRIGCWAYGGWLCCYTTRVAAGKLLLIVTSKPHYFRSSFRLSQLPSLSPTFYFVCVNHNFWQSFANCRWAKDSTIDTQTQPADFQQAYITITY